MTLPPNEPEARRALLALRATSLLLAAQLLAEATRWGADIAMAFRASMRFGSDVFGVYQVASEVLFVALVPLFLFTSIAIGHARESCLSCGYSMAGIPGGVCPECGADVRAEIARIAGEG